MIDHEKKYSISEVSKITGYDAHVLRYYEDDFNLIIPRTETNRRSYTSKEIETFFYIKELQEKGLTNKQIKLVLHTPEVLVSENAREEVALTSEATDFGSMIPYIENKDFSSLVNELCGRIHEEIVVDVCYKLEETKNEIIKHLDQQSLAFEQDHVDEGPMKKDKDILLCENAKLKMKLKEKAYENAELKDKLNRLDSGKQSFWRKIFS